MRRCRNVPDIHHAGVRRGPGSGALRSVTLAQGHSSRLHVRLDHGSGGGVFFGRKEHILINVIPGLDVGMCSALAEDGQIRLTPAICKYPALLEVLVKLYRKHCPRPIYFASIQMSVDSCVAMHKDVADIGMQLVMCLGPMGRWFFVDGIDGSTLQDHRLLVVPRCAKHIPSNR